MTKIFDWLLSRNSERSAAQSAGLLVLRVSVGLMMAFSHGLGKLATYGDRAATFADPFHLGSGLSLALVVFAEFFCALALVLGAFTRGIVVPLVINMATAALIIHANDPFGRKELAFFYLAAFVTILITGPGRYSVDGLFRRDTAISTATSS